MMANKKFFNISWLVLILWMGLVTLGASAQTTTQSVYPAGAGIRVKEVDGSPNIVGVQTLVFPNGTLTRSGQTVTVTVSGGGGTTINSTNGQLPYRVNSTTFGDSAFASNALNSTYLQATSGASGAGVTLAAAGGGTNEALTLSSKGTARITLNIPGVDNFYLSNSNGTTQISPNAKLGLGASQVITWHANFDGGGSGDIGLARIGVGQLRVTNASTGAGQLLIGTSTDTVSAQLDVRSQSTTRPAARFQAASTTGSSQEVFGVYDGTPSSVFSVTANGTVTVNAGAILGWNSRTQFKSPSDGNVTFYNSGQSDFDRLQFGGTSASFPALKRSGATLQFRLADDTAFAAEQSLYIRFGSGSPEGAVSAPVGAIYSRTDGGANTTLYVKESGSGNTGWIAK